MQKRELSSADSLDSVIQSVGGHTMTDLSPSMGEGTVGGGGEVEGWGMRGASV